jgi:hypothetical protein
MEGDDFGRGRGPSYGPLTGTVAQLGGARVAAPTRSANPPRRKSTGAWMGSRAGEVSPGSAASPELELSRQTIARVRELGGPYVVGQVWH